MRICIRAGLAFTAVLAAMAPTSFAQPSGTVTGKIAFRGEAPGPDGPVGFLPAAANPFLTATSSSVFDQIVVVIDGAALSGTADKKPVLFNLLGEGFEERIFPVIAGSQVEIRNSGPKAPALKSPSNPSLFSGVPINPMERKYIRVSDAEKAILITDPNSAHLESRVVGFKSRFFSNVRAGGSFTIRNVPVGTWKVRIWYKDGWIDAATATVKVKPGPANRVSLVLSQKQLSNDSSGTK